MFIALKDMFDKKTEEIKQYVDDKIQGQSVLIENLQSTVQTIAGGHDTLSKKIDALDKKIDDNTKELKSELKIVADYVIGVDAKLNEHEIILKRVK